MRFPTGKFTSLLRRFLVGVTSGVLAVSPLTASQNETIVAQMTGFEKLQLSTLKALDAGSLDALSERMDPDRLEARTREIERLGPPAVGSRAVDGEGLSPIHHYILDAARKLEDRGLEKVGTFRTRVAAPVSLENRMEEGRREVSVVEVDGKAFRVYPLWPNSVMPSLVPKGGLEGPLVYCGDGSWSEVEGKPVTGSVALLDFKGAANLERLFLIGASAVIVLEDEFVQYSNATRLAGMTPSPFPRFYADAATAEQLRAVAGGGTGAPKARIQGGQVYENRPIESLLYHLDAPDAHPYRVDTGLVLDWVGARFGVNVNDLTEANLIEESGLNPGTVLRIPESKETWTVPDDGFWELVAGLVDLDVSQLKAANPDLSGQPLLADTEIMVPSARMPLGIFVPIDSASIVPDLPHGGLTLANLAVALELMEYFATQPTLRLRRDIIFGFIDGDTLGGQGSRLIAEYTYLLDNEFTRKTAVQTDQDTIIGNYQSGLEWFREGTLPEDPERRRWLVEDWLRPRFEEVRIGIAEDRITRLTEGRGSEALPPLEVIEENLGGMVRLRDELLLEPPDDGAVLDRLKAAWEDAETSSRLAELGLAREPLMTRFMNELREEEQQLDNHEHNLAAASRLREITLERADSPSAFALGWKLFLGDQAPYLGTGLTASATRQIRESLVGTSFQSSITGRYRKIAAFAGSISGWPEDYTFIAQEDRATLALLESPGAVLYDDFWGHANYLLLPLSGESDRRERVDTPMDTADRINWDNLALQARTASMLISVGLESLLDSRIQQNIRKRDLSRIGGSTVQFNIRSGIDARDPVPRTAVLLPMAKQGSGFSEQNTSFFYGHRREVIKLSLLNGSFTMPVANFSYNNKPRIYAYNLDEDLAVFTKVATEGQVGTKPQKNEFSYRIGDFVENNLVLIDVYPKTIFIGYNPSNYKPALGGAYGANVIRLEDAVTQGNPRDFAVDNPILDFREKEKRAINIYLPPGDRVRLSIQSGLDILFVLPGEVVVEEDGDAKGRGILVGLDPDTGDRNVIQPLTQLAIAEGMWRLADNRLRIYEEYGISSRLLQDAVDVSGEQVLAAREAAEKMQWQEAIGSSREAWGILVKNFPRVLKLGREAVFSVILLMALAVPGSWFLERLLIGSKGIVARLAGICAIFMAITFFLNAFHPAFQIALSPFIIVIAFTMILMSVIVIALSYGRFEVVLRNFRTAGGEVEGEEISFMSSLGTAFSLGISNLKKRTFRTALTTFTVTVLTFSIVGFVAVKGRDSLTKMPLQIDPTVEGFKVDPLEPAYDGILIRSHNWRGSEESKVASIQAEFGARYPVAVRAAYMEVEGGNSANREGVNQLLIRYGEEESIVNAISLFEPHEPEFSGLNRAVTGGNWFRAADRDAGTSADRDKIILPDSVAKMLGITEEMIVDSQGNLLPDAALPRVTFMNQYWRVIGILDTNLANRIRDVNGKSLALVDYLKSGMATNTSPGEIVTEGTTYHMDWRRLAILPYTAKGDVQAKPRSIAVKLPEGENMEGFLEALSLRLKTEFFASENGAVSMVVPRAKLDLAGLAKVFLPVILCILIVMNTMLGTVEERKGEVGMLGAIGLSPRQIAFLMFSESTVFSILGILFGTFGGLLFANIVNTINAGGGEFLTGLSFNFTSLISMTLATGTGLVVLLATLIPANKAAALAAPSGMTEWELPEDDAKGDIHFRLPFTLTRGNAVGMVAFFNQFLINHNEPTSEDFNCREIRISSGEDSGNPYIRLKTDMWLAPYDLDVAQHFTMRMQAGERESVFVVDLHLQRFSGSQENARRTTYSLLNLVRKQFLLWRNLEPEARTEFISTGAELLKSTANPQPPELTR